jgi:GT2 family glycosyltransferase
MLASIVIPAYRPYTLLDSCLTSIVKYTDLSLIEVIVVCNGSDRESADLLLNKFPEVKFVWYKEALGFTRAANIGFSLVKTPISIICNTDVVILDYHKNEWLYRLLHPFNDPAVGISGVSLNYSGWTEYFPFYFTAIRTELFKKIGYLDLDFSPGYGEDIDFCIRTKKLGYTLFQVDNPVLNHELKMSISDFPLYHKGEGSFTNSENRLKYLQNASVVLNRKWGPESPLANI